MKKKSNDTIGNRTRDFPACTACPCSPSVLNNIMKLIRGICMLSRRWGKFCTVLLPSESKLILYNRRLLRAVWLSVVRCGMSRTAQYFGWISFQAAIYRVVVSQIVTTSVILASGYETHPVTWFVQCTWPKVSEYPQSCNFPKMYSFLKTATNSAYF